MPRTVFVALAFAAVTGAVIPAALQVPPPPLPPPAPVAVGQAGAPRDGGQRARTIPLGTATLSGMVLAADSGRPLSRARVNLFGTSALPASAGGSAAGSGGRGPGVAGTITSAVDFNYSLNGAAVQSGMGMGFSRTVVTDSLGQFTFPKLPAGQYTLSANRDQFLPTSYGQKKPNHPGTPIALGDGQQMTVKLPMLRGGAITGVVTSQDGEPLVNAQVRALRYDSSSGFKRLLQTGGAQTDDRGVYRMFGLQPGEYLVAAAPNVIDLNMDRSLVDANAVESAVAAANVQGGSGGQPPTISVPVTIQTPGEFVPPPGFASTYYPSSAALATAMSVTVNAGEDRSGVDIAVQALRAGNIQGSVTGMPQTGAVQITLTSTDPTLTGAPGLPGARVGQDGRFTVRNLPPGQYNLYAYTMAAPNAITVVNGVVQQPVQPPRPQDVPHLWGRTQVMVDGGESTQDVSIGLQSGKSISGRVVFETQTAPDLSRGRVMVSVQQAPAAQPINLGPIPSAQMTPDGRFTLDNVPPGRYILRANYAGAGPVGPMAAPITEKSAVVNGEDTLDVPFEFSSEQDVGGVTITMSDRMTELSGMLTEANGKPGVDYTILIVATDNRFWTPGSRRIRSTRPGTDGRYQTSGLPAGDYLIAAVTDFDPGTQYDPEFLKALAGAAVRVTLSDGAKRTQDLRVAK